MNKFYVCSRPLIGNDGAFYRHLLGILYYESGKFRFEYKLGSDSSNSNLLLSVFPNADRIYFDHDVRSLLDDYLPSENDTTFIRQILEQAGLKRYNELDWLRTFETLDENTETILYETLPDNIIIHDEILRQELVEQKFKNESAYDDNLSKNHPNDEIMGIGDNDEIKPSDIVDEYDCDDFVDNVVSIVSDKTSPQIDNIDVNDFPFDDIKPNDAIEKSTCENETHALKPCVRIKKTTVVKTIKRPLIPDALHLPPLENPCETIQQRLQQNIAERKKQLNSQLHSTD